MQTANLVDSRIELETALIEEKTRQVVETGDIVELGKLPQALYTKQEYSGSSSLYVILPQHKVAIPYSQKHQAKLVSTIADTLAKKSDLKSSQAVTDYPIVTHVQLEMWYTDYEIVEQLVTIEVYKQPKTMSGWEQRRLKERKQAQYGHSKLVEQMEELRKDPYYAVMSEEDKLAHRRKLNA